ncbi:hypothetical protein F5B21DRAFT_522024 [Xylaria acuta]|nr:hypothetical protein F5B21DRAFT_522024 [Xylaria acuta]
MRLGYATKRRAPKLMIDDEVCELHSRGLANAGFETEGLTPEVELVRRIKSPAEVEILRAVNTGTVAAVRATRPCPVPGLTENEVRDILDDVLLSASFGLITSDTIQISAVASSLTLSSEYQEPIHYMAQITGAHLPEITRGISSPGPCEEKLRVWDIVLEAQSAAAASLKPNKTAASVDIALAQLSRRLATVSASRTDWVTGSGLRHMNRLPYLNKWNRQIRLELCMIFTNEPRIYGGKFEVRQEDSTKYVVMPSGEAELLTGQKVLSPYDP